MLPKSDELLSINGPWILFEREPYTDKIYGGYTHSPEMQKKIGLVLPKCKGANSWRILYFRGKNHMYILRWTGIKIFSRRNRERNKQ
jgi:hypothetical protein